MIYSSELFKIVCIKEKDSYDDGFTTPEKEFILNKIYWCKISFVNWPIGTIALHEKMEKSYEKKKIYHISEFKDSNPLEEDALYEGDFKIYFEKLRDKNLKSILNGL